MEKTRKRRVVLTQAQREEVVLMYKDGANQYELADMFDVSQWTISNIVRKSGYDRTHVGGAISRRIKTLEEYPTPTMQSGVSQHEVALVVTQRIVVLDGLGTHWKYLVDSQATVVQIDNGDETLVSNGKPVLQGFKSRRMRWLSTPTLIQWAGLRTLLYAG